MNRTPLSPAEATLRNNLMEYRASKSSCRNDTEFGHVIEQLSTVLALIAVIVYLTWKKKSRHFPHNIPAIICLAIAIRYTGFWIAYEFEGEPQQDSKFLCWFLPVLKSFGFNSMFYSWMVMLHVLYKLTVKQVLMCRIRRQRKFYYAIMLGVPFILVLIPTNWSLYEYNARIEQCVIKASGAVSYLLLYLHPTMGVIVFLVYGTPVIKTLIKTKANFLTRSRLLMLRDEAIRHISLGIAVFIVAVLTSYVGLERLLIQEVDSAPNNIIIRKMAYTTCVMYRVCVAFFGLIVSLVFICTRENYYRVKKLFYKSDAGDERSGDDDNTMVPYRQLRTPGTNDGNTEKARQKAKFPSGFDNQAQSTRSVAIEGANVELRTNQVLHWVRDKLEIDGVRLNEAELMEFVSEVEDTYVDNTSTPETAEYISVTISDDSSRHNTFVVNEKIEQRFEDRKQHWIETLQQQEADSL